MWKRMKEGGGETGRKREPEEQFSGEIQPPHSHCVEENRFLFVCSRVSRLARISRGVSAHPARTEA